MLTLQLHTNVSIPRQFRTRYHVDAQKLETLIDKLSKNDTVNVRDCYGVLRIKRSADRTLSKSKRQTYFTVTVPDYLGDTGILRGYTKHTPSGWKLIPTTFTIYYDRISPTAYNIYRDPDTYLITPSDVVMSAINLDMDDHNDSTLARFVDQDVIRGERFIYNLVTEVRQSQLRGRDLQTALEDSMYNVTGPAAHDDDLDAAGLAGTPLSFIDAVELGHGDLAELLSAHFTVKPCNRWIDILTHSDNLKWHGELSSPYTAQDREHYYNIINQLKPLAITAAKGVVS